MLHDYVEIFACLYEDIPGLDTDIVVHSSANKRGLLSNKAEGLLYASRDVRKDQDWGYEAIQPMLLSSDILSLMGCKCGSGTKERWKSVYVCRL